jgi:50S ribosome-binding GTPase
MGKNWKLAANFYTPVGKNHFQLSQKTQLDFRAHKTIVDVDQAFETVQEEIEKSGTGFDVMGEFNIFSRWKANIGSYYASASGFGVAVGVSYQFNANLRFELKHRYDTVSRHISVGQVVLSVGATESNTAFIHQRLGAPITRHIGSIGVGEIMPSQKMTTNRGTPLNVYKVKTLEPINRLNNLVGGNIAQVYYVEDEQMIDTARITSDTSGFLLEVMHLYCIKNNNPSLEGIPSNTFPHIILNGDTGVGKSSFINMLAENNIADANSGARGVTPSNAVYPVIVDNKTINFWDTAGYYEDDMGTTPNWKAQLQLIQLAEQLREKGPILYLQMIPGGRGNLEANGKANQLLRAIARVNNGDTGLIVSHLENHEGDMDDWGINNREILNAVGFDLPGDTINPHRELYITTTKGRYRPETTDFTFQDEYNASREKAIKLIDNWYNEDRQAAGPSNS